MQHPRAATQDILKRIESLSGKSVQLMRDDSLSMCWPPCRWRATARPFMCSLQAYRRAAGLSGGLPGE